MERLTLRHLAILFAIIILAVHPHLILLVIGFLILALILSPFVGIWRWLVYGGANQKKEYHGR